MIVLDKLIHCAKSLSWGIVAIFLAFNTSSLASEKPEKTDETDKAEAEEAKKAEKRPSLEEVLIPMEAWIHDPFIDQVKVSPDGTKLVALTLTDINKAPEITVWDIRDLTKAPIRFKPKYTKAFRVSWLNSERLFVTGLQKFDYRFGGKNTKWFNVQTYVVDWKGKRFRQLFKGRNDILGAFVENRLPKDSKHILVRATNSDYSDEFFKINLKKLTSERVYRGGQGKGYFTDVFGNVVGRMQIGGSGKDIYISTWLKNNDTGKWQEVFKNYAAKREGISNPQIVADGTIYVTDNTGREFSVLRTYDLDTGKLSDPIMDEEGYELRGVITSTLPENFGEVIGYRKSKEATESGWIDPFYKQMYEKLKKVLPEKMKHNIISMSDDKRIMVIGSKSSVEAGAYHLLIDGKNLMPLGRRFPHLDPAKLAPMKFVKYKARDGLEIPAYLTEPITGEKPFPTIIMPHGGPWARDFLGWDRWVQFLANRGYAVLQPQYRGTDGFGQKLWRAGDREWGQKMQDDKDDGAQWLVDEGIADKGRIAMFGYSYGGYAAMAAVVRENSPYQCAIAGAGLSELASFDKITYTNPLQRQFQNPTIAGLSPLHEVKKANIPIFIFHGDRDQRVPVEQSRKFVKALKKHNKPVEYLEIPDLWHSHPWFPQHHLAMLSSIEDYLANRCGEGGL